MLFIAAVEEGERWGEEIERVTRDIHHVYG